MAESLRLFLAKSSRFAETIGGDWFDRHCHPPYQEFESLSLRHTTKIISYLALQTGRKFGRFPTFSDVDNAHAPSEMGLRKAGEPNFLRILEPPKMVWYGISRKINR
ncbi:hypothetical protein ACVWWR_005371 [Bradyrhizobium sp. LM3.2]